MLDWNWILLLGGALLILVEVALGGFAGFDLVLIGSAFVLGGAIGMAFGNPAAGFLIASALCVAYIALGRRWVRDRIRTRTTPSNVDALVGIRGVVTVRVAEHEPGQVRVRDEVWRALPVGDPALEPGAVIVVTGVDGVTLHVKRA
jgi:membrane protein implicated in regulation of membrane protease activity